VAELCRICEKQVRSLFEHLRIDHQITTVDEYNLELDKAEAVRVRRREYGAFIDELNERKAKGLITGEEWRMLSEKWRKENPE
jgi:hypothetical protein